MYRSRLPAFSMIEILVVMVLSTIIVGIIYFSFTTIQAYQRKLAFQKQSAEDIATLYYILKKDVQQSAVIRASAENAITCVYPLRKEVEYLFFENRVLRRQLERVDTFLFGSDPKVFWTDTAIVKFPAVIDEIQLLAKKTGAQPSALIVHKFYDAATLIPLTKKDSLP